MPSTPQYATSEWTDKIWSKAIIIPGEVEPEDLELFAGAVAEEVIKQSYLRIEVKKRGVFIGTFHDNDDWLFKDRPAKLADVLMEDAENMSDDELEKLISTLKKTVRKMEKMRDESLAALSEPS
jgi:hypothetical protein